VASGMYSTAMGFAAFATGTAAVAVNKGHSPGDFAFSALEGYAEGDYAVGIGTNVHANGYHSMALGSMADANGKTGAFVYGDLSTNNWLTALTDNQFVVRAQRFWLGSNSAVTATAGRFIETSTGAYLSSGGTWTNSSDSTKKTDFREIDGDSVLAKLASMPVRTWRYRDEDSTVRHMGPTAQEFRAAFSLGDSDKAIATVDADGVSLAAIQALERRVDRLTRQNDVLGRANRELRAELGALDERLRGLQAIVAQLSALAADASLTRRAGERR